MKKSISCNGFVFWSNTKERTDEPPHVHVGDPAGRWEGRLDLVTAEWLDPPLDEFWASAAAAAFESCRIECLKLWANLHDLRAVPRFKTVGREPSKPRAPHSLVLVAARWKGKGVSVRFADGHRGDVPVSDLPQKFRTRATRLLVCTQSPRGVRAKLGDAEVFLPADWLRARSDAEYRRRMQLQRRLAAQRFGELVRKTRTEHAGMTPRQLGEAVGFNPPSHPIQRIEAGDNDVCVSWLVRIACAMRISPVNLVSRCRSPSGPKARLWAAIAPGVN